MSYPHVVNCCVAYATPIPAVEVITPSGQVVRKLAPVSIEWHRARHALAPPTNYGAVELVLDGMEVGVAKSAAARSVLERHPIPEFLFFLDYDVIPEPDAVRKLVYRARCYPDHDIFCGVYCLKDMSVPEPLIYADFGSGPYWDWAIGDLLIDNTIKACHMGLSLIRSTLLKRMQDADPSVNLFITEEKYGRAPDGMLTKHTGTEDLHFCKRAVEEFGAKILIDTGVLAAHQDYSTGIKYGLNDKSPPVQRAKWLKWGMSVANGNGTPTPKRALDLGAGGLRREWPGYDTYTTDLRPDTRPDFVQDTRYLTLQDCSFDLVASSHHLEHIPRFEQEKVWSEIFRITKQGGHIEHVVPSVEWAAGQIVAGVVDEHVLNVLYGAQEGHGYERTLNLHYFGYTKDVGKALAEAAGFVNVQCIDWRDNPDLGYNLIITGEKPAVGNLESQEQEQEKKSADPLVGVENA